MAQRSYDTEKFYFEEALTSAYAWATKAQQATRVGTYGKGNAPPRGCIGLLLILNSIHNTATCRSSMGKVSL